MLFINDFKYDISKPRTPDGIMFAGIHVTDGDNASTEAMVVPPVWYWHAINPVPGYEQDQDDFRLFDFETCAETCLVGFTHGLHCFDVR